MALPRTPDEFQEQALNILAKAMNGELTEAHLKAVEHLMDLISMARRMPDRCVISPIDRLFANGLIGAMEELAKEEER